MASILAVKDEEVSSVVIVNNTGRENSQYVNVISEVLHLELFHVSILSFTFSRSLKKT